MSVATTSGQQLLLPESSKKQRKERRITVAINSRDRNITTSPNSNNFRWTFRRPLKDILSVELVSGCVPAEIYTIGSAWSKFIFIEGSSQKILTLTPGQYDASGLAAEVAVQLNTFGGTNSYTASWSPVSKKLTVTGTGGAAFGFAFSMAAIPYTDDIDSNTGAIQSINCPARLLGFDYDIYRSSAGGTLIGPYPMDPDAFSQRLYLYLNVDSGIELHRVELGAGRKDCFHVIFLDDKKEGYYYLQRDTYSPVFTSFPAPLARLSFLDISLRDEFFRLVDLGRKDYTLLFEITYLE
jgi:hypothetical protein